ncbi:biotin--[acetyl-CoA-carboxylase] ligase [Siminovitchia acidinfaciens]|uniref:Bifunctional ligase/repressor BirA n=1 Tax=Siminovitchia acidinfaciens TaxID=2321395 RepID=A0A429XY21_9BACI|nr:biotin--[acetyl-CoA-carboxylase] ligase [Siminovitchia acidinfaciens]RST73644.1 biotin--[acetyl-CoA-carboxylase] ligase [Siminovitchia acidinfaciens]
MRTTIRQQLIEALSDADGKFLSGQALAEIIGCSRTAIWKHIEELRKDGFVLEAVRNKGYRIIGTPENMTENEILFGLETERFGRSVHYFDSLESTQKAAYQLAYDGAPEGTLVIAEEQTSGRGRLGRAWHSASGKGIWMSIIVRPDLPPQKAPQFTLITAVAVARAIEEVTEITPEIKWPNDLLIKGKKVVGILTELQAEADKISSLIIGIGMNVNHASDDFPVEVKKIASSLFIEKGEKISRAALIQSFLKNFEKYYSIYISDGFLPIRILWESYATSIGKQIKATTVTGEIVGVAVGISNEGVLKIEDEKGVIHNIYSADIEQF